MSVEYCCVYPKVLWYSTKGTASPLDTLWALIALKRQMQCYLFLALHILNEKEGWFTKYEILILISVKDIK